MLAMNRGLADGVHTDPMKHVGMYQHNIAGLTGQFHEVRTLFDEARHEIAAALHAVGVCSPRQTSGE